MEVIMNNAINALVVAVLGSVEDGAPSGTVYSALMTYGISLDNYNQIISALTTLEAIEVKNHYITQGKKFHEVLGQFSLNLGLRR
jgi:hypothetical protein